MVRPWDEARPPPATESPALLNVEVAPELKRIFPPLMVRPEDVAVNPPAENPAYRVEVPAETKFATPWTDKIEPGVEVPIPRLPAAV